MLVCDCNYLINVQELQEEIESLQDNLDALRDEQQTLVQARKGSAGTVKALQARIEQHEESLKRAQAAAEAASDKHRMVLRAAQEELQRENSNWADEVDPVIHLEICCSSLITPPMRAYSVQESIVGVGAHYNLSDKSVRLGHLLRSCTGSGISCFAARDSASFRMP